MTQHKDLELFAKNIRIQVLKAWATGLRPSGRRHVCRRCAGCTLWRRNERGSEEPSVEDRDYFVMSKGHAGPALYAALALKGYFPVEQLLTINTNGTRLPSHPDRNSTTGVDMSTGSLGQGMSTAIGIRHRK